MTRRRTLKARRIFTVLASILSLLAIIRWLRTSPELPTALLVSTPWNETFPFHLVDKKTLSSSALRLHHWPDRRDFFPTHVIAHPFHSDVFLATNEVESGSVVALRLVRASDPYLIVLGSSDSGGRAPAHCVSHRQSAYCTNVCSLNFIIRLTLPVRLANALKP